MGLRGVTHSSLAWVALVLALLHARRGICYTLARAYPLQLPGGCKHAPVPVHQLLRMQTVQDEGAAGSENASKDALSKQQLLDMIESGQLQVVPDEDDEEDDVVAGADFWEHLLQNDNGTDDEDDDDDGERSSKKQPWRKVQRIIRRQFIKVPKRYLKKLIRQLGLRRQLRSAPPKILQLVASSRAPQQRRLEVYLRQTQSIGAASNGRFDTRRVFILEDEDEDVGEDGCDQDKGFF